MYHIKKDKRSQKSAQLIVEGLHICLEDKNLNKITISDIQKTTYVGRATFYRHFDSLSDVIEYECDQILKTILKNCHDKNFKTKEAFSFLISNWMKNEQLLLVIIKNNLNSCLYSVFKNNETDLKKCLTPNLELNTEEANLLIKIATSTIINLLEVWIDNGKKENVAELTNLLIKIVKTINNSIQLD